MRSILLFMASALIFSACTQSVSFTIDTPAIKNGSFFIRNQQDSTIFSGNIKNGVLKLNKPNHLPAYCLLNSKWQVVEYDITWDELPIAINRYLKQH